MARLCETPGIDVGGEGDRALAVAAGDRLEGGPLLDADDVAEAHEPPAAGAHEQTLDVLRALSLGPEEAHPDVEPPALVLELADALAADRGVDGVADLGHRDPEVGRLVAVGDDLYLGHADLVVAVHVGDEARLAHPLHDRARGAPELVPVGAADVELHGEAAAAAGAEAALREVLHHDPGAGKGARHLPRDVHQVLLRETLPRLRVDRALGGVLHRHEEEAAVDLAPPEAADEAAVHVDLRPRLQEPLDLGQDAVARVEARAHRGLEPDPEAAHVLGGYELLAEQLDDSQREHEEGGRAGEHELPVAEGGDQQALVAGREAGEGGA